MRQSSLALLAGMGVVVLGACATSPNGLGFGDDAGGDDADIDVNADVVDAAFQTIPSESYGAGVTAAEAAVFKNAPGSASPFVFDPPSGVVLPAGWSSPEMLVHTSDAPWLVRLEIDYGGGHTAAYTALPATAAHSDPNAPDPAWWTIRFPADVFAKMQLAAGGDAVTWRVLYAQSGASAPAGMQQGTMRFLPGADEPDVTYWQILAQQNEYSIERVKVGAASTATLVPPANTGCTYGCHTTTPDGEDIALNVWELPPLALRRSDVLRPQVNAPPVRSPIVSASAGTLLDSTTFLIPTVSAGAWTAQAGHWIAGAYTSNDGSTTGPFQIGVVQVDAGKASLNLAGDPTDDGGSDVLPAWSPDASRIVFVRTSVAADGYVPAGWGATADLYSMPVTLSTDGLAAFGAAAPVPYASGTPEIETYPGFSPDGALLTFMRAAAGTGGYDEVTGDVYVMKSDGSAAPVRIAADDAPADASVYAGGMTNSWPRFGRKAVTTSEGTYYPLVFSSRRGSSSLWNDVVRGAGRPFARLVYTVVLVKTDGSIQTFPGAIVPDQRVDAGSHCPDYATVTSVPPPGPN